MGRVADLTNDWHAWLQSWELQQDRMMRGREERFTVIVDAVRIHCGESPRVLDLGAGPGSLAARLVRALPGASVVAVERDPVVLEVGRHALEAETRIRFVERDLADPGLVDLGSGFDAAVSTTALHWLDRPQLGRLYRSLGAMLRPRGLFLNGDHLQPRERSAIDHLATAIGEGRAVPDRDLPPEQTWDGWWEAIEADPGLASAVARRRVLGFEHPHHPDQPSLEDHELALTEAGFSCVGILWQRFDDRVLAAMR
jgi:SAM-dependent methyltransferase